MRKRSVVALTAAVSILLASCGNGGPASTTAGSDKKTEPVTKIEIGGQPAETGPAEPVTLNVVTTYADTDSNAGNFQTAVAEWEKLTGHGVNDGSAVSNEAFKARVQADFENGTEPDVLFYFNGSGSNNFVKSGKVVPLEEIRAEYPEYASNMNDSLMAPSPVDGKIYAVPVNGYWEALYVNKTIVESCGFSVPGPDTAWDEFLEMCEGIREKGYTPIAVSLGEVPHYWFEFTIYNHLNPAKHSVLPLSAEDEYGLAWQAGLEDIKGLYEAGYLPEDTLTATNDEISDLFLQGQAAFLLDGSWKVGSIVKSFRSSDQAEADETKLQNFTITYVPGAGERKSTDIISGLSSGYYITRKAWEDPEKRAAAVSFVEYMTSAAVVTRFAGTGATALKNGAMIDEDKLSSLERAGMAMLKGMTGTAAVTQDNLTDGAREWLFAQITEIVTGQAEIPEVVEQALQKNAG